MDENVRVIESEAVQQLPAKAPVDERVKEALERLSELRKHMPPIDGAKLIREGREMPDRGSRP